MVWNLLSCIQHQKSSYILNYDNFGWNYVLRHQKFRTMIDLQPVSLTTLRKIRYIQPLILLQKKTEMKNWVHKYYLNLNLHSDNKGFQTRPNLTTVQMALLFQTNWTVSGSGNAHQKQFGRSKKIKISGFFHKKKLLITFSNWFLFTGGDVNIIIATSTSEYFIWSAQ